MIFALCYLTSKLLVSLFAIVLFGRERKTFVYQY